MSTTNCDRVNTRFVGVPCQKAPATQQHRLAIWENMLGTVYAMNDAGQVEYFDYDITAARVFAGVGDGERDPRVARMDRTKRSDGAHLDYQRPRHGQKVLWVLKAVR